MLGTASNFAVLSPTERGRFTRTSARIAVSALLFFRGALPADSFFIGNVNGIAVPLLNEKTQSGSFVIDLLEIGVMPLAKQGKIDKLELCIYDMGRDNDWLMLEAYDVNFFCKKRITKKKEVAPSIRALIDDITATAAALEPLPLNTCLGVGLRVSGKGALPAMSAIPGFAEWRHEVAPLESDLVHITQDDASCEIRLNLRLSRTA
ncbi:hypothetical protein DIPPA_64839 [Diplonema papillatum]|nr:hypothetical protein DIPPA_64839 [Diplonema papillatum]